MIYCKERLDVSLYCVEQDEVIIKQLSPPGSSPQAVHEQIAILHVRLYFIIIRLQHVNIIYVVQGFRERYI